MRSTTPLVVLLQATSLALAAPAAFRRDQHLHGAVQVCLRMTLSDIATGHFNPSAVEVIKCHDDDPVASPSAKSTSPSDTHDKPPSRVNAQENNAKTASTKGADSPKPQTKPASNDARPNKNSNGPYHDPHTNQDTPKTSPESEGPKHHPSTPAATQPASSSSGHDSNPQPTQSTHAPAPSQPAPSSGPGPHNANSGPGKAPASNSDTNDDGSGVPRINLDHLQPLVEIKANVKALDNAKDGTGRLDAAEIKDAVQHGKPTDATSLASPSSIGTVADANASVIKNPGPADVLGDHQAKANSVKDSATSKVVPQEVSHSPMTETASQNTSDSTETISKRPAEAADASPLHDAARVDLHASATKASVPPLI
ncbi:hypothetical protein FRC00_010919 [Tulasnella sp. 408]|nr:hypothetical protein FRC00_010919 [Tulasnella sp. 408]